MFKLGQYNLLRAVKHSANGLYLGGDFEEVVLLPKKFVPKNLNIGDEIEVFLYTDSEDRLVATTQKPKITLGELGFLLVKDVTKIGLFLEWGLDKDLFMPFQKQQRRAKEGETLLVSLCMEGEEGRLFASSLLEDLKNELTVKVDERVRLDIGRKSELGYEVIINKKHVGLLYFDKVFRPLRFGDTTQGYIETIRPDGKIDVSLQKKGYAQVLDSQEILLNKLKEAGGTLMLTDKSDPKEISKVLGMSKKVFKKSVGALYKEKKISIEENCIKII